MQISATPNKYCNLKTSKMGKTWHFIFATVDTLKQNLLPPVNKILSWESKQNKTEKVKTIGLPSVKRFLYSHIARLHTLFF
jgi:hypothetical protein